MFKRPGVPFFTRLGVALFLAGLIVGGGIVYVLTDFTSVVFAAQLGAFIGLAMMVIRWRISEELVIKQRRQEAQAKASLGAGE